MKGDGIVRKGPRFILEILVQTGQTVRTEMLTKYDQLAANKIDEDPALLQPWMNTSSIEVKEIADAVTALQNFVDKCSEEWGTLWAINRAKDPRFVSAKQHKEQKRTAQQAKNNFVARFAKEPLEECRLLCKMNVLDQVKASYAYSVNPTFAYNVAWQTLCKIKADSIGSKAFTVEFGSAMTISAAEVRTRALFNSASTSVVDSGSANA